METSPSATDAEKKRTKTPCGGRYRHHFTRVPSAGVDDVVRGRLFYAAADNRALDTLGASPSTSPTFVDAFGGGRRFFYRRIKVHRGDLLLHRVHCARRELSREFCASNCGRAA